MTGRDLQKGGSTRPRTEKREDGKDGEDGEGDDDGSGWPPPFPSPPCEPLVLDLDGDGVELVPVDQSQAHFDFDFDGFREKTGWVAADDGTLIADRNQNGVVDGVEELFGSPTQDGFSALALEDANGDGRIDMADPIFATLRVWRDLNGDGAGTADETPCVHP